MNDIEGEIWQTVLYSNALFSSVILGDGRNIARFCRLPFRMVFSLVALMSLLLLLLLGVVYTL